MYHVSKLICYTPDETYDLSRGGRGVPYSNKKYLYIIYFIYHTEYVVVIQINTDDI